VPSVPSALTVLAAACGSSNSSKEGEAGSRPGVIHIDGQHGFSDYQRQWGRGSEEGYQPSPDCRDIGTGAGPEFCRGETDINDASRPIRKTELEACKKRASTHRVADPYDGLAVV